MRAIVTSRDGIQFVSIVAAQRDVYAEQSFAAIHTAAELDVHEDFKRWNGDPPLPEAPSGTPEERRTGFKLIRGGKA
jgi:hypothetical protein